MFTKQNNARRNIESRYCNVTYLTNIRHEANNFTAMVLPAMGKLEKKYK
jgi:hypothetical protein